MPDFTPAPSHLFFSKNDPQDIRLGDLFKPAESAEKDSFALFGYPDDEGIKLNGGRPGAALAPSAIRQFLYKMTPASGGNFADLGDLSLEADLPARHQLAQNKMTELQTLEVRTISLGGGHDYGYPDAGGFLRAWLPRGERPVVLNFDAHLDVRPTAKGFNSGTPFFRLLSEFGGSFDFAEIGIQPQCNSPHHREWALAKGARIFNLREIENGGGLSSLLDDEFFRRLTPGTPVFISFDIDALSSNEAHGCSQSWVTGLKTADYLKLFAKLSRLCDVRGLGIYEVSPPLDTDNRTAKTAALIAYHFLFQDAP